MATSKLGLPTLTGNMTHDVPRDINALANAIDDKAGASSGFAMLDGNGKVVNADGSATETPTGTQAKIDAALTPIITNLTLQNGATVSQSRTPRASRVGKRVVLSGEIMSIAAGTIIAVLPVGLRPSIANRGLFTVGVGTLSGGNFATIFVNSNGEISIYNNTSNIAAISLNGIVYDAEA